MRVRCRRCHLVDRRFLWHGSFRMQMSTMLSNIFLRNLALVVRTKGVSKVTKYSGEERPRLFFYPPPGRDPLVVRMIESNPFVSKVVSNIRVQRIESWCSLMIPIHHYWFSRYQRWQPIPNNKWNLGSLPTASYATARRTEEYLATPRLRDGLSCGSEVPNAARTRLGNTWGLVSGWYVQQATITQDARDSIRPTPVVDW